MRKPKKKLKFPPGQEIWAKGIVVAQPQFANPHEVIVVRFSIEDDDVDCQSACCAEVETKNLRKRV